LDAGQQKGCMKTRNRLIRAFTVLMRWLSGVRFERRPVFSAEICAEVGDA